MPRTEKASESTAWFSQAGPYDDVILSTRSRLARNLADFPFPAKMTEDDRLRVNSLAYDAFSSLSEYNFIGYGTIPKLGRGILADKNFLGGRSCDSVVLCEDDATSVLVNESEHLKISTFLPGLDCEKAMARVYKIDEFLQERLQFAASYSFGYLTSRIKDCGTGLKTSLRCFIPSVVLSRQFDSVVSLVRSKRYCIEPLLKDKDGQDLGNFIFDVYPACAAEGTELEQMAIIQSIGLVIMKTERKIRRKLADNNSTIILNFVRQSYARGMYSMLLPYDEAVKTICVIKWGLQTGFVHGISEGELNSLLYTIKGNHLLYFDDNFAFSYEADVKSDPELRLQRLRAIVIQDAFEKITVHP